MAVIRAADYLSSTKRYGVKSIRGRTMEYAAVSGTAIETYGPPTSDSDVFGSEPPSKIAKCYPFIDSRISRHGVPTLRMRAPNGAIESDEVLPVTYRAYIDAFGVRRWRTEGEIPGGFICNGCAFPYGISVTLPPSIIAFPEENAYSMARCLGSLSFNAAPFNSTCGDNFFNVSYGASDNNGAAFVRWSGSSNRLTVSCRKLVLMDYLRRNTNNTDPDSVGYCVGLFGFSGGVSWKRTFENVTTCQQAAAIVVGSMSGLEISPTLQGAASVAFSYSNTFAATDAGERTVWWGGCSSNLTIC